jgi:hypothetical protein
VALTGFTDGTVRIWVLWVRDLSSHLNGSKSIVVKDQASGLGSGHLRQFWDLRTAQEPLEYLLRVSDHEPVPQPPRKLGVAGPGQWPALEAAHHQGPGAIWSVVGEHWDRQPGHRPQYTCGSTGPSVPKNSSILCCVVSPNNQVIITGSQGHASVYQITY